MDNERLTWEQIKQKYPHQNVGLVDVENGENSVTIKSAIVKYTSKDKSYKELVSLALAGKIRLIYTTIEEDELEGVLR